MEAANPAYTIPVVRSMRLWEIAAALRLEEQLVGTDGLPLPRDGYAYPDPDDPYSHLKMRVAHELDATNPLPEPRPTDPTIAAMFGGVPGFHVGRS